MIRRATLDDLDEVFELSRVFHAYSVHRDIEIDEGHWRAALQAWIGPSDALNGAVFLSENGLCAGLIHPLYFNPSILVAAELMWWAPKDGAALRLAFEAWAEEQGARIVQFSSMADERRSAVERLFRRAGYAPVETIHFKRL